MRPEQGATSAGDPYVPGLGNGGYRITRYELDLDYRMGNNRLGGNARLTMVATQALSRFSLDLASGLRVAGVAVNGRRAGRFAHRGAKLHIWPPDDVQQGTEFAVDVRYGGNPGPEDGPWGEAGWDRLTDGVVVTGRPGGAATWFPCNDHPADKAGYRIAVTTESPYRVVTNGRPVSTRVRSSRTSWVFDQPAPMPAHLVTMQIGRYDAIELTTSPVPIQAVLPSRLAGAFATDFGRQQDMMRLFVRLFGPYPFGDYTVVVTGHPLETPLPAQGVAVFGDNHLDGRRGSERLIANQLAHQWFGNSVTPEQWCHIWLSEGFACYAEWLWSEYSGGPSAQQQVGHVYGRLAGLPQDLVISDPGPENMFDDRLSGRAAIAVHAIRLALGDDGFFALLRAWTRRYRHGTVTTHDFAELACGFADVRTLLRRWLDEPTLPPPPQPSGSAGVG